MTAGSGCHCTLPDRLAGGQRPPCAELFLPHYRNAGHSWPGSTFFPQNPSHPAPVLGGYAPVPSVVRPQAGPFSSLLVDTPPRAMASAPLHYQQYPHSLPRVQEARGEQTPFTGRPAGGHLMPQNDAAARLSRTSVEYQQCASVVSGQWPAWPGAGGSYGTLQPGAGGSYGTLQPGAGGSYGTLQPGAGGSYGTLQPGAGQQYCSSQPGAPVPFTVSQQTMSRQWRMPPVNSQSDEASSTGSSSQMPPLILAAGGCSESPPVATPVESCNTAPQSYIGYFDCPLNGVASRDRVGQGSTGSVCGTQGVMEAGWDHAHKERTTGQSQHCSQRGTAVTHTQFLRQLTSTHHPHQVEQDGLRNAANFRNTQYAAYNCSSTMTTTMTMTTTTMTTPSDGVQRTERDAIPQCDVQPLMQTSSGNSGSCSETQSTSAAGQNSHSMQHNEPSGVLLLLSSETVNSSWNTKRNKRSVRLDNLCKAMVQNLMSGRQSFLETQRTAIDEAAVRTLTPLSTADTVPTDREALYGTRHCPDVESITPSGSPPAVSSPQRPDMSSKDGVRNAANFRNTQCAAYTCSSTMTTRTPSTGVQRTERDAIPQCDVQPLMQTSSGNSGSCSETQSTSAAGQNSLSMQHNEPSGVLLLLSSETVNSGWNTKRNKRSVRLDNLCKAMVQNLMSGRQSFLETQRTAIDEAAVRTLTPLSTADTVPTDREALYGTRHCPDVGSITPSGSPPAVSSPQRPDMSSKLYGRDGFYETASQRLCRENLFCIGNENKDMAPERKEQVLRTVPVSLSHADSDSTNVQASSCKCVISRTGKLKTILAPSDLDEDWERDIQCKECLAKSEIHSQLETDVNIMSSLYNIPSVGSHRFEDNAGHAQVAVSTLVDDMRDAVAVAGHSRNTFPPSDSSVSSDACCGDAKDICTCYDSKNGEEVLPAEAAVSLAEGSRDGVWARSIGDLFHKCLVCRRIFSNSDLLERHLLEHMGCEGDPCPPRDCDGDLPLQHRHTSDSQRPADSPINLTGTSMHGNQTPSSTSDVLGLGNSEMNALVHCQRDVCGVAVQQDEAVPVDGWQSQRETLQMQHDHTADLQQCEECAFQSTVSSVPGPSGKAQQQPQHELTCHKVSDVLSDMVLVTSIGSPSLKMSVCHCDQPDAGNQSAYLLTGHVKKKTHCPEDLQSDQYPNRVHQQMETTSEVISDRHDPNKNGSHCSHSNNTGFGADSAMSAQEGSTELRRSNLEGDRPGTLPEAPDVNATPVPSPAQRVCPKMSVVAQAKQADTDHSNASQPSVKSLMPATDVPKSKSAPAQRKRLWSETVVTEEVDIRLPKGKNITKSSVTSQQQRQQCTCSDQLHGCQRTCVDEHTHTDSTHRCLQTPRDKEPLTTNPKPLCSRHVGNTKISGAQLSQHAQKYKTPVNAKNKERIVKSLKNFFARNAAVLKEQACKNTQRIIVSQRLEESKRNTAHTFVNQKLPKNHQRFEDTCGHKVPKTKEDYAICAKTCHTAETDDAVQQQCFGDKTARAQPERKVDSVICQQICHTAEEISYKADDISHTPEEICHSAEEISHTAEEIFYTEEESSHTAEEISHTADESSHTAEEISHTADESSHTAEEISHTAEDISHTAETSNKQRVGHASECQVPEKKDDSTSFEGDCLSVVRARNVDSGCAITGGGSSVDGAAQSASHSPTPGSKAHPCKEQGTGSDSSHSTEAQRPSPASEEEQTDMAFCWVCMTLFTKQSLYDDHGCHQARASSTTDDCSDLSDVDREHSSTDENDENAPSKHSLEAVVDLKRAFTDKNNTFSRSRNVSNLRRGQGCKKNKHLEARTRRGSPTLSKAARWKDTDSRGESSCMFTCDRCDQVYSSREGLLFHWKTVHKKIVP